MTVIAYQGEPGAFSEEAALTAVPEATTRGFETFDSVADALSAQIADLACLPVENTIFGSIGRAYDLVHERHFRIVESRKLLVHQCLVGKQAVDLGNLRSIASHPVALEQCRMFLARMPQAKLLTVHDTAGAVRAMMDGSIAADACIASEFAATSYHARVLARNIQDDPLNYTRFFLLARAGTTHAGHSTDPTEATIFSELRNERGSLRDALSVFAKADINLTNLVCRPIPSQPWSYRFFFELACGEDAAHRASQDIARLGRAELLGCYPALGP